MTVRKIIIYIADFIILCGIYQFYFSYILKLGWKHLGEENESLIDYISREYKDRKIWQKRKQMDNFNIDRYFKIRRILGVFLVLLGIVLFASILLFQNTKYGFLIDVIL